jgi:hypothetical protein
MKRLTPAQALAAGYVAGAYHHDIVSFGFPNETQLRILLIRAEDLRMCGNVNAVVAIEHIPASIWDCVEEVPA